MATYNIPGIYVEEVSTGATPISSVSTTTTAFVGQTALDQNFVNEPTACNSFEEFCRKFVPEDRSKVADCPARVQVFTQAVYGYFCNGGSRCYVVNVGSGSVIGDMGKKTGVHSLDGFDEIALVAAPGSDSPAEQNAIIDFCERMGTCFAILDGPAVFKDVIELTTVAIETASAPGDSAKSNKKAKGVRPKPSSFAAVYCPHVLSRSPFTGENINCPPSGHVAGIYARTDNGRGVHKAPANIGIRACVGLSQRITASEQGQLNSHNVNCIRYFHGLGIRVWGARTLSSDNPEWRYVNVRRLFLMIEESIRRGTTWTVFEPNDEALRQGVIRSITAFLTLQWQSKALVGGSPNEAFFVKCDGENNPQASVDEGRLIVDVGIAPVKPAEFIVFRIGQWQGDAASTDAE